jgi:hypothetical protein
MDNDPLALNTIGPSDLVNNPTNKSSDSLYQNEGIVSEEIDILDLPMSDEELLALKQGYESSYATYEGTIKGRQELNKKYLLGKQNQSGLNIKTTPSNLLFEATATFVPQALAKNPEPVVFSDNTEEGKLASNDVKTVLQFLAMTLGLRKKLGLMVWHWGIYFTAVMKYGWDKETDHIKAEVRKPKNFLLDPDGYVNEFGEFQGWLGERRQCTAQELADDFPSHKEYIKERVGEKMGTQVIYTEWWTDKYCFTTFKNKVLDKHKNELFNYEEGKTNHFATPKKPYTFLSVFSMQEQPHDFTNLIEQNIANQDRINKRDNQIEKNLDHANNSLLMDDKAFTSETAHQGANALEQGDPILGPKGSVERLPAPNLPNGVLESQNVDKDTLRGIYGTQGLSAQKPDENTTARGMILNQSHDSSRIGGGMGDSLETVAQSFFNWMLQLTYVFYDEKHYAAIMGQASAVEYVGLQMVGHQRQYVVSVSPNSMQPKDELTQVNQTLELWKSQAIDPIGLFKGINDPDPMQSAERLVMWTTNPQNYALKYFPQSNPQIPNSPDTQNPPNQVSPMQQPTDTGLGGEPANASLSQVPLQ